MNLRPRPLLDVHPLVGGAQDLFHAHPALGPADAEARPDPDGAPVDPYGRNDGISQTYGQVSGVRRPEAVRENDEFVTSEPRDRVAVPDTGGKPPRDLYEHRVTRVVAEAVVDGLEAVEVAEEDREPLRAVVVLRVGGERVHMVVPGPAAGRGLPSYPSAW